MFGTGPYAGNSAICPAAVHAGLIPQTGGIVYFRLEAVGQASFASSISNNIESIEQGAFPATLNLLPAAQSETSGVRWLYLAVTLTMLAVLSFLQPSNFLFYSITFIAAFIYIQFVMMSLVSSSSSRCTRRLILCRMGFGSWLA